MQQIALILAQLRTFGTTRTRSAQMAVPDRARLE